METTARVEFNSLSFYTLEHSDKEYFIHQHIVDAFQAQTANMESKPIGILFSLVGLYLYIEKNYTGRQVQLIHMQLTRNKKQWPTFKLPDFRGIITVTDVLKSEPGETRDTMIKEWCVSVWDAYTDCRHGIKNFVRIELGVV